MSGRVYWLALIWGILLHICMLLPAQTKVADRIAVCDNYLHIRGESNINEFSFYYNSIPRYPAKQQGTSGDTMNIIIPVKEFEASNTMMYKDFLDLMKEEKFPEIYVSFSTKQLENTIRNLESCPQISITIAGITKIYTVDCMIEKCSGSYYLKGNKIVKLSDFNLKPPARLLGLVKVNNEIDVNFGFIITFTDNSKLSVTL